MPPRAELLPGTLDLLILKAVSLGPLHGYGVSQRLATLSRGEFQVNPGSLFPSLYRLEQDGKLKAEWRASDNNRRAKYYALTRAGRRQLESGVQGWQRLSAIVGSVLNET